jgi:hypothetical protein
MWRDYVGHKFLHENGFDKNDFTLFKFVSSWAVCGFREENNVTRHCSESDCAVCYFTNDMKVELGRRVKYLLEVGRVRYLEDNGYKNVRLITYVDASVTPENTLIMAQK